MSHGGKRNSNLLIYLRKKERRLEYFEEKVKKNLQSMPCLFILVIGYFVMESETFKVPIVKQ